MLLTWLQVPPPTPKLWSNCGRQNAETKRCAELTTTGWILICVNSYQENMITINCDIFGAILKDIVAFCFHQFPKK